MLPRRIRRAKATVARACQDDLGRLLADAVIRPDPGNEFLGENVGKGRGTLQVPATRLLAINQDRDQRRDLFLGKEVIKDSRRGYEGIGGATISVPVEDNEQAARRRLGIVTRRRVNSDGAVFFEDLAGDRVFGEDALGHVGPLGDPTLRRGIRQLRDGPMGEHPGVERIGLKRRAVYSKGVAEAGVLWDAIRLEPDVRPFQALEFPLRNICGWDIPEDDDVPGLLVAAPDKGDPSQL